MLRDWLDSEGEWTLGSVERNVEYRGRSVVKLNFRLKPERETKEYKPSLMFWVDLERGAIPLKTRWEETADHRVYREFALGDVRWVGDRGWMPFWQREYRYNREALENGRPKGIRFWEYLITKADFDRVPPRSEFRLELNEPRGVIHAETHVSYGKRDVWDLDAIAPAAARGKTRYTAGEPPTEAPVLPGERAPGPWWALPLLALGGICLAAGGWTAYRRLRHA